MKLWIDDVRLPPDDSWELYASNFNDARVMLVEFRTQITHVSFDHDLGERLTGYDIAKFIEYGAYLGVMPPFTWTIHSDNPAGAKKIRMAMVKAAEFWAKHAQTNEKTFGNNDGG